MVWLQPCFLLLNHLNTKCSASTSLPKDYNFYDIIGFYYIKNENIIMLLAVITLLALAGYLA